VLDPYLSLMEEFLKGNLTDCQSEFYINKKQSAAHQQVVSISFVNFRLQVA